MYIIVYKNRCYYSKTLIAIARELGVSQATVRRWFKDPKKAIKKDIYVYKGIRLTSNKEANNFK